MFAEPDRVVFPVTPRVPATVALPVALIAVAATVEGVPAPSVVASIAPLFMSTFGNVVVSSEANTIFAVPELLGCFIVSNTNVLAMVYSCSPFL